MKILAQASSYVDGISDAGSQISLDTVLGVAAALVPAVIFLTVTISWRIFRSLASGESSRSGGGQRQVTQDQIRRWRGQRNSERRAVQQKLERDVAFHKWNSAQNPGRDGGPSIYFKNGRRVDRP